MHFCVSPECANLRKHARKEKHKLFQGLFGQRRRFVIVLFFVDLDLFHFFDVVVLCLLKFAFLLGSNQCDVMEEKVHGSLVWLENLQASGRHNSGEKKEEKRGEMWCN